LYDYTAPDGSNHYFILTGLGLLGATPPGISDLKSVQDVAKLYEVDSPIAAAIGEIGGKPVKFTVEAASASEQKGEPEMALSDKVAEALGIDATADEAAVLAKIAEMKPAEPKTDEPVTEPAVIEPIVLPVAAAAPAPVVGTGVVQIEQAQLDELKAAAAQGVEARARQIADDDEHTVMAAIGQGKIAPARKAHWLQSLKADREGTKAVLASLAAGLVPLKETGHQGVAGQVGFEGAPDAEQQLKDYAHGQIMARLGVPVKKGVNN
jgi:hypothetical protein